MQEGDLLMRKMAEHLESAHASPQAKQLTEQADELLRKADALREMVTGAADAVLPTEH
jgi:hypothetical protein